MKKFLPSSPISGGLFLSYKCNATCKHCIYASSPKWESDWISPEDMEDMLTSLAGSIMPSPYGPKGVSFNHGFHFTGGEPFLNFDLLLKGVKIAHKLGIPSLFVETNAFWCRDDEESTEKIQQLKSLLRNRTKKWMSCWRMILNLIMRMKASLKSWILPLK